MPSVLAILRKDVRRLRLELAVFWLLLAVSALTGPFSTYWSESQAGVDVIAILASAYLVAVAIHQEALPGDCQYWLTRPIGARHVLAAKLLFIAICTEAPVLLAQLAGLQLLGIPPQQHLVPLFWHQVYFTTVIFVPIAVIASVTRNLTQLLLGVLLIVAGVIVLDLLFRDIMLPSDWLSGAVQMLAPLVLLALLFALQYARRSTLAARATLTAIVILLFFSRKVDYDAPAPVAVPVMLGASAPFRSTNGLEIPIRISGLPPRAEAMLGQVHLTGGTPYHAEVRDYTGGNARLILQVPPGVRIRGWFNLTLFERAAETRVPGDAGQVSVPGTGVCGKRQPGGFAPPVVRCLAPSVRTALALQFPNELRWVIPPGLDRDVVEYTMPFQPVRCYTGSTYGLDLEKAQSLVTVRTLGYRRAEFDFKVPE